MVAKVKEKNKNTALRRIKYLTLMQIGEKFRLLKEKNKKKLAFSLFLAIVGIIAITAAITFGLSYLSGTFQLKTSEDMFVTVVALTQLLGIITCLGSMISVLYTSRENTILLAFPCKYSEIFISKIVVFAFEEFKKSFFFVLPFLVGFGIASGGGVAYWLQMPIIWIMMCLLPVFISALLSIPCIYIKRFLESNVWLYSLFIAGILAGSFVLIVMVLSKLPTPMQLVAIYGKFVTFVETAFASINKFSLWYTFMGKMVFGRQVYLYLPVMLIIFAALGALCFLIAMPFYFKAVSSATEHSRTKKHRVRKYKYNSLFLTLLRKELKLFFRSSKSVTSAITIVLVFPIISYVLNFILAAINTNTLGDIMTVAFNLMITLSLLGTHNANCAMEISKEGSEFAVLKAAPSKTMLITWAKVVVAAIIDVVAIVTTIVMLVVTTELTALDLVLMAFFMLIVSLGHIFWSFQLDITNPKINDYAVKGDNVIDNVNVAKSIAIGFGIATVMGLLSMFLLLESTVGGWIKIMLIGIAFLAARLYLYNSNLKVYFDDIQA